MKTTLSETPKENAKSDMHYTRPDVKSYSVSHTNEEQLFRENDATHKPAHTIRPAKKI